MPITTKKLDENIDVDDNDADDDDDTGDENDAFTNSTGSTGNTSSAEEGHNLPIDEDEGKPQSTTDIEVDEENQPCNVIFYVISTLRVNIFLK